MKKIFASAVLVGSVAFAGTSQAQVVQTPEMILVSVQATCTATPDQCASAMAAAIAALQALGLSGNALNSQIGQLIAAVAQIAGTATPEVRAMLAAAIGTAAAGFTGPNAAALAQAANQIASAVASGSPIDNAVFAQLASNN